MPGFADRVQETSTTTGTGTLTLAGSPPTGYRTFATAFTGLVAVPDVPYVIDDGAGNWEVGRGTYTVSGTTLTRDVVIASSNSGALVSFAAGTKNVWVDFTSQDANEAGGVGYAMSRQVLFA